MSVIFRSTSKIEEKESYPFFKKKADSVIKEFGKKVKRAIEGNF